MSNPSSPETPATPKSSRYARRGGRSQTSLLARGEPMMWLTGGGLVLCVAMVVGLLWLIFQQGIGTLWPSPLVQVKLYGGGVLMGEVTRDEIYRPSPESIVSLAGDRAAIVQEAVDDNFGRAERSLLRTGNFDVTQTHFHWVSKFEVDEQTLPEWGLVVERMSWGRFYGFPKSFEIDGKPTAQEPEKVWGEFQKYHEAVRARWQVRRELEEHDIGHVNHVQEAARQAVKELRNSIGEVTLAEGKETPSQKGALEAALKKEAETVAWADKEFARIRGEIGELNTENRRFKMTLTTASGEDKQLELADIVRMYPANRLSFGDKVGVYFSRWGEFLLDDPREANSEGGVFPAIWGTVAMTLIMSLMVVPFGVLAALYLREYAKGGFIISAVRIAINNLAGVPSIVFGVFGLGFFCQYIGADLIDPWFYSGKLPSPTFGTGGLMWASLTLALLTLPVVIVSTEEALAAVPRSMREGSYACGASKWQTIRRIVLPRAMPGIMTGAILAMARGAGEVAPLMLVGAVKLAQELPVTFSDWSGSLGFIPTGPIHPNRSFMHLGFHIYDLGFQSQNSEAAKPMVFTTTLLLITIIALMNVAAIYLRMRMRRKFVGGEF